MLARWSRVELIVIDELGYVPLAEVAAELLFQIIAERAEKFAVIATTNLSFSEWPQVFTNASPTKHTSSRPDRSPIASGELCGRRRRSKPWVFGSASPALSGATLQQNRAPPTSTSRRVGQNKPPKWATPRFIRTFGDSFQRDRLGVDKGVALALSAPAYEARDALTGYC
jgi:hypothetical protein